MTNYALFSLPSVRQFIDTVVDDLVDGRSVIVLVPDNFSVNDVTRQIRQHFFHREIPLWDVYPAPADDPVELLAGALGIAWSSTREPHTLENLLGHHQQRGVVFLSDMALLDVSSLQMWLRTMARWAGQGERCADAGNPFSSLLMVLPATLGDPVPQVQPYLSIRYWWGFPSVLETHLLSRMMFGDNIKSWEEYLLGSLAAVDVELMPVLRKSLQTMDTLLNALRHYADQRGWQPSVLAEAKVLTRAQAAGEFLSATEPPPDLRDLWARGWLGWTQEHRLEVHPAVLAALAADDDLRHRVWRAQTQLLLPEIDYLRQRICDGLTQRYGMDWAVRWHQPQTEEEYEAVQENPRAVEWGHLVYLLTNVPELKNEQVGYRKMASLGRRIRNQLAHYTPITRKEYSDLFSLVNRYLS